MCAPQKLVIKKMRPLSKYCSLSSSKADAGFASVVVGYCGHNADRRICVDH